MATFSAATLTIPPRPYTFSNGTIYEYNGFEQHVVVPDTIDNITVTAIAAGAFSENAAVQTITLPQSVTSIGNFAFMSMENLLEVFLPTGLTTIGDAAFHGCGKMTNITFHAAAENPNYASVYGVLLNKNKTLLLQCPAGKSGVFNIPYGTVEIDAGAFIGCRQLTVITMPNTVKTIGAQAFEYCTGLTWITIPATVTNLSYKCFACCTRLQTVAFVGTPPTFGDYVFESSQLVHVLVRPGSSGWGTTQSGRPVVEWWPLFLATQQPRLIPAGFTFTIANAFGQDVAVSATSDLTTGAWIPLTNGQKQHDGERLIFTDPDAASHAQRFYRPPCHPHSRPHHAPKRLPRAIPVVCCCQFSSLFSGCG